MSEMPDGWKNLYCPPEMSDSCASVIMKPSEAREICNLMKEMAEEMEYLIECGGDGYDCTDAKNILKKFKEWK